MSDTPQLLAIIPARGGSKRVLRKNIREFLGKPLIAWTIDAAKESGAFDRVIVLTDDAEVAEVAKQYGAEVPFMEPAELATDAAYIGDALRFALDELAKEGYAPKNFMLLEPSSVGRTAAQIREAAALMTSRDDFDSLVGISEVVAHFSHLKQLNIGSGGLLARVGDSALLSDLTHRNQDIEKSYYINSALYGFRSANLASGGTLWGKSSYGYVMDGTKLVDIDTEDDWFIAEAKMKRNQGA